MEVGYMHFPTMPASVISQCTMSKKDLPFKKRSTFLSLFQYNQFAIVYTYSQMSSFIIYDTLNFNLFFIFISFQFDRRQQFRGMSKDY